MNIPEYQVELTKLRLSTIPNFNLFGGCGIKYNLINK